MLIFFALASILDVVLGRYGLFGIRSYLAVSTSILVMLYVRWGKYALLVNIGIATIHLFLFEVDWSVRVAHALSILSLAVVLLILKMKIFRITRVDFQYVVLAYAIAYLTMFFVEWLLLLVFNQSVELGAHALNRLFDALLGIGLLTLIAMQKELLVRMEPYLREKNEEKQLNGEND